MQNNQAAMVTIRLPRRGRNEGRSFEIVGVNGAIYQIACGAQVEVPDFVAQVLEHRQRQLESADAFERRLAGGESGV